MKRLKGAKRESSRRMLHELRDQAIKLEIKIDAQLFGEARVIACTLVGSANKQLNGKMFSTLLPLRCVMPTASPLIGSSGISPLRKTMKSARIAPKKFLSLVSLTCTAPMWTVASILRNCLSSPLSPPICTMSNFRTATA